MSLFLDDRRFVETITESHPPVWRVKHDPERLDRLDRPNLPEIYRVLPYHHIIFTAELQWLWYETSGISDPLLHRKLGGNSLYLFNGGHGWPGHADHVNGMELDRRDPRAPIMLICGGAIVRGRVGYSIMSAIQSAVSLAGKVRRRSVMIRNMRKELVSLVSNNVLWLNGIDIRKPLPTAHKVIDLGLRYQNVTIQDDDTIGIFPQGKGKPCYTPLFLGMDSYLPLADLQYIAPDQPIPDPRYVPEVV